MQDTCIAERHGDDYKAYTNWNCRCPAALAGWKRYKLQKLEGTFQPERVDATGMRRRIQALQALGWSQAEIGEASGLSRQAVSKLTKTAKARQFSIDRIARAYDQLSTKVPAKSYAADRARNLARREGWAPPLAWDNIDDPSEQPHAADGTPILPAPKERGTREDPCLIPECDTGRYKAGLCGKHLTAHRGEVDTCKHPMCTSLVWRGLYCRMHDIGIDFAAGDWFDWVAAERLFRGQLGDRKPTIPELAEALRMADRRHVTHAELGHRLGLDERMWGIWRGQIARLAEVS